MPSSSGEVIQEKKAVFRVHFKNSDGSYKKVFPSGSKSNKVKSDKYYYKRRQRRNSKVKKRDVDLSPEYKKKDVINVDRKNNPVGNEIAPKCTGTNKHGSAPIRLNTSTNEFKNQMGNMDPLLRIKWKSCPQVTKVGDFTGDQIKRVAPLKSTYLLDRQKVEAVNKATQVPVPCKTKIPSVEVVKAMTASQKKPQRPEVYKAAMAYPEPCNKIAPPQTAQCPEEKPYENLTILEKTERPKEEKKKNPETEYVNICKLKM
uniref:Uncharacterized protein n=1 Tax=Parastrongyloides trichosuri TaxID=131310 RepID=A0A0N4ZM35_PARTI